MNFASKQHFWVAKANKWNKSWRNFVTFYGKCLCLQLRWELGEEGGERERERGGSWMTLKK